MHRIHVQGLELVVDLVASGDKTSGLDFGDLKIDAACTFVYSKGRTIQLTRSERALLQVLVSNPRRLMSRSRLLDEIATSTSDASDRNIDFLVNRLRSKLGDKASVHQRKPKGKPTPETMLRANGCRSKVCSAVEHVFAR